MKKWSEMTEREIFHLKKEQCSKCIYYVRNTGSSPANSTCDYLLLMGHRRGCSPLNCKEKGVYEEWKGGKIRMARLIDADDLIDRIKRNDDLPWHLGNIDKVAFESCVKNQPTVFDVGEIAGRIESSPEIRICGASLLSGKAYIPVDVAAGIVRNGIKTLKNN